MNKQGKLKSTDNMKQQRLIELQDDDDDVPVDVLDEMSSEMIIQRRRPVHKLSKLNTCKENIQLKKSCKKISPDCPPIQPKYECRNMDSQLSTDSSKTEKNEATMITVGSSKNSPKIMIPSLVRDQGWVFGEEIGSGGFSHVYRVQNTKEFLNESERGIACKVIDLFVVNSDWARKHFRTEIRLCEQVNHPNLLRALKILKMRTKAYIFMPLAMYGTVTEYLIGHKRPLVESMVRRILRDLADGVGYLHVRNIVHRDLKLDNFLLIQKHKVVIADFGFAVIGDDATQLDANKETMAVWCSTICGTPEYVAPEIHGLIRGQQYDGKPADMYALGVSAFEMLHMVRPFRGGPFVVRSPELLRMQINCEFILIPRVKLSNGCSTLIHSLMNPKPQSRPTAATVLTNKWITT